MSLGNTPIASRRFLRRGVYAWVPRKQRAVADQADCGGAPTVLRVPAVADVVNVSRLLRVFHDRKRWAGPAAGLDGLSWSDIGRSEAADGFRAINRAALAGHYVPHPERRKNIPRPGRLPRPLDIGTVADRVVAASLADMITPLVETVLSPYTFAYRPKRGYLTLLAWLAVIAEEENRWVVGNHDIRQAFPSIPLDTVMAAHRQLLVGLGQSAHSGPQPRNTSDPTESLLQFIERVVRGADNGCRLRGLSQGNPYSSLAMNLFTHVALGANAPGDTNPPRLTYSDNIVDVCRSVPEGQLARNSYQLQLSAYGLTLKEVTSPTEPIIADLCAGETTQLLGFSIRYENGAMGFGIGNSSWETLKNHLEQCHLHPNPQITAKAVIDGWVTALGPAYGERTAQDTTSRVLLLAREMGFREMSLEHITRLWKSSWCTWRQLLTVTREKHATARGTQPK